MGWRTAHSIAEKRRSGPAQTTKQAERTIKGIRPLRGRSGGQIISAYPGVFRCFLHISGAALVSLTFPLPTVHLLAQSASQPIALALPAAPEPQIPASSPAPEEKPCPKGKSNGTTGSATTPGGQTGQATVQSTCPATWTGRYMHFLDGPRGKTLTPRDKAWLAARNVSDPFNIITILGEAAISVGADSHSAYGPGMSGYGKYVGVSFSQDMTGEFVGTFLISSIAHQDPRYHRMPHASVPRRVGHGIVQVVWTQGDDGKPMPNYANLVGYAIDDEISNLYVPGRRTDASATISRYVTGLAFSPIDNFITEFLPDVASKIHVQVVIVQRIINQVARTEGGAQ